MHRLQFEIDQFFVERGDTAPIEPIGKPVPGLFRRGVQLMPIEEDVALVGVKIEGPDRDPINLQRGADIETVSDRARRSLHLGRHSGRGLLTGGAGGARPRPFRIGGRKIDRPMRVSVTIVIDD